RGPRGPHRLGVSRDGSRRVAPGRDRRWRDHQYKLSRLRPADERARRDDRGDEGVIIAVDGPAAAGKGTLARRIARHYRFDHLDTGRLYRATALEAFLAGIDPADPAAAAAAAKRVRPEHLGNAQLTEERVARA